LIGKLVVENLKHRPVRTLLSVLAIAIEVTMMLTLVGVSRGTLAETARRARGVGADIWVKAPGTSVMSFSTGGIPEAMTGFFEKQPHVVLATGSLVHSLGGLDSVSGVDLDKFNRLSGGFDYLEGGPFRQPDDILVDDRFASQRKLKVGSRLSLMNRQWRVCGIIESGKLARVALPLRVLQDLAGATGKLSQIFLKLDDPARANQVVAQLRSIPALKGYPIYSIEEFTSMFSANSVPMLAEFTGVVVALAVIVGFLVVFLSMYTAVLERTREIGILKSLGASPAYVLGILVRETALLAAAGSALGIGLTYGTRWLMMNFGPSALVQLIVPDWWPIAAAIAVAGALLGTLYPGWKAARQDALEALSYE
jgi:putative ABC transport system permease protein